CEDYKFPITKILSKKTVLQSLHNKTINNKPCFMKNKLITTILLMVCITSYVRAQEISYTYDEVLRMGDDATTEEYFFSPLDFLVSDQDGNIFVGSQRLNLIRKYNSDGQHIIDFGGRGRGPGEFIAISSLFIDLSNDQLVVVDRISMRASFFTLHGEYKTSHEFSFEDNMIISPWIGRAGENDHYYLLYRLPQIPGQALDYNDFILHEFDLEMNHISSFVHASIFGDLNDASVNSLIGGPTTGFFEFLSGERLVVVPYLYTGELYLYEYSAGSGWQFHRTLQEPIPQEVHRQIDANTAPEYARITGTPEGPVARLVFSESVGMHFIEGGMLAHYSFQRNDDYLGEFSVSIFDLETGEYLGTTIISELNEEVPEPQQLSPIAPVRGIHFNNGKLYFIDNRSEESHVVVGEVIYEEE
ncbi:MAG: 6-bladed beta-propeller, partial [Balneolaceae bacterium]